MTRSRIFTWSGVLLASSIQAQGLWPVNETQQPSAVYQANLHSSPLVPLSAYPKAWGVSLKDTNTAMSEPSKYNSQWQLHTSLNPYSFFKNPLQPELRMNASTLRGPASNK